jgi:hypothetical protein
MPKSCPECRFTTASCRCTPHPLVTLSDGLPDDLVFLIPAPRISQENRRTR